jgi:phosphonate transport system substrate-binding protein
VYDTTTALLKRFLPPVAAVAASLLLLTGCATPLASGRAVDHIDLTVREPLPAVGTMEPHTLRIGVAAVLSPEGTVESYAGLAEYIGEQMGRPTELVQRRTYAEVNALIDAGEVDVAFVCTSAYVRGRSEGSMDLLVVPEIEGSRVYHSSIIVPASSSARSMEDLRGAVFAFTDPMSLTGRLYASSLVLGLGHTPETFFSDIVFTYSHDDAISAVASGVVDGAGVDDLVLRHMIDKDPSLESRIRVIDASPDFGIPPVVVPVSTSAALREALADLLLGLEFDPSGQEILASVGVDRFVLSSDDAYGDARELIRLYDESA